MGCLFTWEVEDALYHFAVKLALTPFANELWV
jgi:hypothetical protein